MVQKAVMYNENIHKFPSYIFKSIFKVKNVSWIIMWQFRYNNITFLMSPDSLHVFTRLMIDEYHLLLAQRCITSRFMPFI